MDQPNAAPPTDAQRRKGRLIFQSIGGFDLFIGGFLALFGPRYFGGDPVTDQILEIGGLVIAAGGVGTIWIGRRLFRER